MGNYAIIEKAGIYAKFMPIPADNKIMDISGIGSSLYSSETSGARGAQVMQQISVAVFKQQQDQQQRMADALIEMMKQTPSPSLDGTGQLIDVFA